MRAWATAMRFQRGGGGVVRDRKVAMFVGALALVMAVLGGSAFGSGDGGLTLRKVRLADALPTKSFLTLGTEETETARWAAFAYRAPHSKQSDRLCLQIPTAWALQRRSLGGSPGVKECGSVAPDAEESLAAFAPIHEGKQAVLVVATGREVATIRLLFASGEDLQSPLRLVRGRSASSARVSDFGYAVFKVSQRACIRYISGELADGGNAFESEGEPCLTR
jgi:hypothetical protein